VLGILQLWFKYFAASFLRALGISFNREAKERDALVVSIFFPLPLLMYR